jgi:hypothetical protein
MCANKKCACVCVLGANMHVNVGVREWMLLKLRESTCESVCVGANTHVNGGVRELMWLNVRESPCASVCVGCKYKCERRCS